MRSAILVILFVVVTCGLSAKERTFTFEAYDEDYEPAATVIGADKAYMMRRLASEEPVVRLAFELSPQGNGAMTEKIGDKTVSIEVRAIPKRDLAYRIKVKYDYVSAYDGDKPITSSHRVDSSFLFKVGEPVQIAKSLVTAETGGEQETHSLIMVAKLTE